MSSNWSTTCNFTRMKVVIVKYESESGCEKWNGEITQSLAAISAWASSRLNWMSKLKCFLIQIFLFQLWPFKQTWTWQRSSCSWRWGPSRRTRRTSPPRLPWCCTFHAWLKDNLNFYSQREHPHRWKATLMYLACSLSSLSILSTLSFMYLSRP